MTDAMDRVIYPYNDDALSVAPTIGGAPLSGRTDVTVFLSTTEDMGTATAIAGLSVTLTEVGNTGVYTGVMDGGAKASALAATPDGTTLYRHIQVGTKARRVMPVTFKRARP